MWKAFDEMEHMGWIGPGTSRLISVQAAGCAPIVRAYRSGDEHAEPWTDAETIAAGLRVPAAVGDFLMLKAIRDSGGCALSVTDEELMASASKMAAAVDHFPRPKAPPPSPPSKNS